MTQRVYKIAVVVPKYGLIGGAEGFAAEITERLSLDPRWDFHVFANRWISSSDRIAFHKIPIVAFPKFLTTPSFAFFADRQIRKNGIDLIHTHERIFNADLFTMHGVPHRFWISEVRRKRPSLYDRVTAGVEKKLVFNARCKRFLPVSSLSRNVFLREYGVEAERVRVIHPGVDLERYRGIDRLRCRQEIIARFGIAAGTKIILFVGMNYEVKGLDILMNALARLAEKPSAPSFHLLVVGKGNIRKYKAFSKSLKIDKRVSFVSTVPGKTLTSFYAAADLYAMLSRFDTFGMVVLEAMAAALPVLVSDCVGAKDLIQEDVNGAIVPVTATADDIAGRLAGILQENVPDRMGQAARKSSLAFSWEKAAEHVAAAYEEILRPRTNGT